MKPPVRDAQSVPPPASAPALSPGSPTTLHGWRARVRHQPAPPPIPPVDGPVPVDEDDPRVRYHAQLSLVETTDIATGMKTARRMLRLNGERRHPCQHVAIDSDCRGTGKRTLLHHIGLAHQGRRENRPP